MRIRSSIRSIGKVVGRFAGTVAALSGALAMLTTVAAVASSPTAMAAQYQVDASHSSVNFKVKHLMSKATGNFDQFSGKFEFDEKAPTKSSAEFSIDTKSINTRNEKRDEHLRSADFFDADKYPTISFKSTQVKLRGKNRYALTGDLTMHGVTKPVTFDVEYKGTSPDGFGNVKSGFSATTKVNRKDFGILWNKQLDKGGFVLGDDVTIEVELEGQLESKKSS